MDDHDLPVYPVGLPPPAEGVHVWQCELERSAADVAVLEAVLTPAEMARAARFGRSDLRARYVVGRATLRALLGRRLGLAPGEVAIERGRRGRPQLGHGTGPVDFNVSHTRGIAVIAMATHGRIGIDIEHGERALNIDGVGRKFMSAREQAGLAVLSPDDRRRALLRLWTCKEAMSKATGDALSAPFRNISIAEGMELEAGPPPYTAGQWRLLAVEVPGGYLATVALWHGPANPAPDL